MSFGTSPWEMGEEVSSWRDVSRYVLPLKSLAIEAAMEEAWRRNMVETLTRPNPFIKDIPWKGPMSDPRGRRTAHIQNTERRPRMYEKGQKLKVVDLTGIGQPELRLGEIVTVKEPAKGFFNTLSLEEYAGGFYPKRFEAVQSALRFAKGQKLRLNEVGSDERANRLDRDRAERLPGGRPVRRRQVGPRHPQNRDV